MEDAPSSSTGPSTRKADSPFVVISWSVEIRRKADTEVRQGLIMQGVSGAGEEPLFRARILQLACLLEKGPPVYIGQWTYEVCNM
jgi:hypothetical protein